MTIVLSAYSHCLKSDRHTKSFIPWELPSVDLKSCFPFPLSYPMFSCKSSLENKVVPGSSSPDGCLACLELVGQAFCMSVSSHQVLKPRAISSFLFPNEALLRTQSLDHLRCTREIGYPTRFLLRETQSTWFLSSSSFAMFWMAKAFGVYKAWLFSRQLSRTDLWNGRQILALMLFVATVLNRIKLERTRWLLALKMLKRQSTNNINLALTDTCAERIRPLFSFA